MVIINDGSGGSSSSICAVSPSDMAGQIDNIISRIEALEQDVAELKAQNLSAIQLSDISQNAGWIHDVIYMGVPGWTQTPTGTLIPPMGVSLSSLGLLMSDGNPYQLVSQDSDGILHFGINPNGIASGSQSGSGSLKRLLRTGFTGTNTTNGTSGNPLNLGNGVIDNEDSIGASFSTSTFTLPRTGYYFISATVRCWWAWNSAAVNLSLNLYCDAGTAGLYWGMNNDVGTPSGEFIGDVYPTISGIMYVVAGSNIQIEGSSSLDHAGGTVHFDMQNLSIIEL